MSADIPEPVGVVGGVAAAAVAVAAAVRKVVIPMWKGLQALAKAHQSVIEGAELARKELQTDNNGGHSMKDRLEQAAARAATAQTQAEANADRITAVERQVELLRVEQR